MTPEEFRAVILPVMADIGGKPVGPELGAYLNQRFPAGGTEFQAIKSACLAAIQGGWMCNREAGGIKFGRVIKPAPDTHGFSVDVVDMADIVGPHHAHPNGEIDLVMPLDSDAKFDGKGAGWVVYRPGSAHKPTVSDGRALVLYLLPEGAIQFS
jgi:hypothetical protein